MSETKRIVHCWAVGPRNPGDDYGSTCMLEDGHQGPHEFVSDVDLTVTFVRNPSTDGQ
jgi:hypothetical protein